MATVSKHISHIQNLLNQGVASDDTRYSDRQILHALNNAREFLLKRKLEQYNFISWQNVQTISNLEMVNAEIDKLEDCVDCPKEYLRRSKEELPDFIVTNRRVLLNQVRSNNGNDIPSKSLKSHKHQKYGSKLRKKNQVYYFIHNSYLYIANNPRLDVVHVSGVFKDPMELASFKGTKFNEPCFDPNTMDFPIDSGLTNVMYELTMKELTLAMNFAVEDKNPNASDETSQQDYNI